MKFHTAFAAILSLAAASPIASPMAEPAAAPLLAANQPLSARQTSSTSNELTNGACRRITFIFARGSTEPGNIGSTVGPGTCNELKRRYGSSNVACQGVGGPYTAALQDNFLPQGTTAAAIGEATRLFNLANTKCPSTIITAGGYSQGGAVMHGSISTLSATLRNKISGVVLYGDSRDAQDGGQIPNFDRAKTDIICAFGDLICAGTLTVTAAHLSYQDDVDDGAAFLAGRIGA